MGESSIVFFDSSDSEIVRSGKVRSIEYSNMSGGTTYSTDVYVEKMSDGSYTTETKWEGVWEDIQPEELYYIDWYEEEGEETLGEKWRDEQPVQGTFEIEEER